MLSPHLQWRHAGREDAETRIEIERLGDERRRVGRGIGPIDQPQIATASLTWIRGVTDPRPGVLDSPRFPKIDPPDEGAGVAAVKRPAASSATTVLPMPPAPVIVTRRTLSVFMSRSTDRALPLGRRRPWAATQRPEKPLRTRPPLPLARHFLRQNKNSAPAPVTPRGQYGHLPIYVWASDSANVGFQRARRDIWRPSGAGGAVGTGRSWLRWSKR